MREISFRVLDIIIIHSPIPFKLFIHSSNSQLTREATTTILSNCSKKEPYNKLGQLNTYTLHCSVYVFNSSNLIENDHNFVFFDCKVSTQQHFESEKLRKTV